MIKFLIKISFLSLILMVISCGYSPIFTQKNYNFEIDDVIFNGEKEINKIIENRLNIIQKNKGVSKKKYNLNIYSEKKRNIVSKDSKGDPLKYEMIITIEYKISNNGEMLLEREIKKGNIYNNDNDLFELEQSEKIIIENISGNLSDNIISSIINLDDN